MRRRWARVWDEKEPAIDVIKGYVEVNDEVERETIILYLGEIWMERQRNERNRSMWYF